MLEMIKGKARPLVVEFQDDSGRNVSLASTPNVETPSSTPLVTLSTHSCT